MKEEEKNLYLKLNKYDLINL